MIRSLAKPLCHLALGVAALAASLAQAFPNGSVSIVVPFPPGGPVDTMARLVGEKMAASLDVPVVIENRPGAGGNVGSSYVARAKPDGQTLLMASGSIMTMNEHIYAKLPFSPADDLTTVTVVGDMPLIVAVNPQVPVANMADLVALAKAKPQEVFFSSPGNGTTPHAGAALFNRETGTNTTHVPYKGGAASGTAVIAGEVTGAIDSPPALLPHIQSGRIKALAIAGPERLPQLPDVPTTAEVGLPGINVVSWFPLVAPKDTPPEVLERIHQEVAKALQDPGVRERFNALAIRPVGNSVADANRFTADERQRWGEVIRAANIRIE